MLNLNLGRTLLFAGGTKEIKIVSAKPDLRGFYTAQIRDLKTGKREMVPVKLGRVNPHIKAGLCAQSVAIGIEICA